MYPPPLLTLIITLLGVSSSSSASPAGPISSSSSAPSPLKDLHSTDNYLHHATTSHSASSDDIVVISNNDLEAGCSFLAQGRTYNICPLVYPNRVVKVDSARHGVSLKGKGKEKAKEGEIKVFLGGVKGAKALGSDLCPEGAQTCFVEWEGSQVKVISIGREEHTKDLSQTVLVRNFRNEGREFQLWLKSDVGDVQIILTCGEDEGIEYESRSEELRVLRWRTPHACPIESTERVMIAEGEDEGSGEEEETELKEDELPVGRISRGWLGFMVLLIATTLITATILISSRQTRHYVSAHLQSAGYAILPLLYNLKHITRPVVRNFPNFKVGESRLVRWAQEDMTLDGDEDVMVNGSAGGPHGWGDLEVMDEYIPLKSSPASYAKGKSAGRSLNSHIVSATWSYSTYGSVPFEGLDVDESEVDMPPRPEGGVKTFVRSASEAASMKVKGLLRR